MHRLLHVTALVLLAAVLTVHAQFKEVGPRPFSSAVARQRIKALLEKVDPDNGRQTVATLTGLLVWYRDLFDEELIAAWQRDERANLPQVIKPLADSRVASSVVEFSWRRQRQATFNLTFAPMFSDLMARYPDSARPFLDDLLGTLAPDLSHPEAEGVCRILIDMPDTETWKSSARQILPRYRGAAENVLNRDIHGDDREKAYRAQLWLGELRPDATAHASEEQGRRRERAVSQPSAPAETNIRPSPAPAASLPYAGPRSGTLECRPGIIPQNAEYVFPDLPPGKLQFDYDTKTWDARLLPGEGRTQRLILINKSRGAQKRCVVHWSIVP